MPAIGSPVASTTTSTSSRATASATSDVRRTEAMRAASQPRLGELRRHAFGAKIGDRPHRNAGHMRHLREKHGAEFPRPDKRDADRSGLFGAAPREVVQVHARFFPSAAFALAKATLRQ